MPRSLLSAQLRLAIVLAMGLLCASTQAQTAQELNTRTLAATCANCHGTDGRPVGGSDSARLAGQSRDFLIEQLNAFRSGSRPATVMHQITKGLTPQQVEQVADYFAAIKR